MPDTRRNLDAFLNVSTGLFKDNNSGDISAQDLRDFVLSVFGASFPESQTASFTAVAGTHYLVDLATAAADVTVTLPASPAVGDKVRVTVRDDDLVNHYAVKLARNGSNFMASTDVNVEKPYWLFMEGETVELTFLGGGVGWTITHDGRIPITLELDPADWSLASGAETTMPFTGGAVVADPFGIEDNANYRWNILRRGRYDHIAHGQFNSMTPDDIGLLMPKYGNPAAIDYDWRIGIRDNHTLSGTGYVLMVATYDLVEGDTVETVGHQTTGSNISVNQIRVYFRESW